MTCKTTSLLTAYLEDSKDTDGVLALIRDKYPRSMSTYLTMIRKEWLTLNTPGPLYRHEFDSMLKTVALWKSGTKGAEAKSLEASLQKLREFDDMNMTDKYATQRGLKVRNYTGHAPSDGLLINLSILPEYINNLRLTLDERTALQQKATASLLAKSASSYTVSGPHILDRVRETLRSRRSNVFDLACALSVVTGRRMIEIFRTGTFHIVDCDTHAAVFSGQAKKKQAANPPYRIPLLDSYEVIDQALNRLRISKNTEDLNNSEVNLRYSSSCNAAARRLLGEGRHFHDARAVYGVMSFHLAMPHTLSLNLWLCRALGHSSLVNSLNYSSIHIEGLREEDKRTFEFDLNSEQQCSST